MDYRVLSRFYYCNNITLRGGGRSPGRFVASGRGSLRGRHAYIIYGRLLIVDNDDKYHALILYGIGVSKDYDVLLII